MTGYCQPLASWYPRHVNRTRASAINRSGLTSAVEDWRCWPRGTAMPAELSDRRVVPGRADHGGHYHGQGGLLTRMREATGTVYGDIGTSVLYTVMEIVRESVRLKHHVENEEQFKLLIEKGGDLLTRREALGGLSLVFWALIFLTIKYDLLIMRADNRGEGGTFALWAILKGYSGKVFGITLIGYLVVAAAGLLAAD